MRERGLTATGAALLALTATVTGVAGCAMGGGGGSNERLVKDIPPIPAHPPRLAPTSRLKIRGMPQPGTMPPLLKKGDVYAATRPKNLAPAVRHVPERVWVPNSDSNTVDVIDPKTYKVVDHFATGRNPQHITPSWDMRTLWIDNDLGNSLTPIDPKTGKRGRDVPVLDPYNMYFTPDGRFAIVVAEAFRRLDFRNAQTMRLRHTVHVPCIGVDHMDFTANGRYALASCEFSGELAVIDVERQRLVRMVPLRSGGQPQDVKLSPDGRFFFVADQASSGVWLIGAKHFRKLRLIHTGLGTHGLYASRDSKLLYATNRREGSISVLSFKTQKVVRKWHIPGGGSPDMGGVSSSGKVLWLSGRYNAEVYAISTKNGRLIKRIKVGSGPHGLAVFPQPGRYSLGHNGVFR